jgi:AcrR family transcriptional regulator
MLATADCDQLSVAQISLSAKVSIGAFYVRFSDKDAFLNFVITNSLLQTREIFQEQADVRDVASLTSLLVEQFAEAEFAGIIRAAVKLGFMNKRHRKPFDEFQAFVSNRLAELLLVDVTKEGRRQRIAAIDSALAILTHAALFPNSQVELGEIETQQVIIDLLSGKSGSTKPLPSKKPGSAKPQNSLPKSTRDPESLLKPIATTVKSKGSTRGPKKSDPTQLPGE